VARYVAIDLFKIIWRSKKARVIVADAEFHLGPHSLSYVKHQPAEASLKTDRNKFCASRAEADGQKTITELIDPA
jgi:hypothetical protein